ncbi:unnamed protein product [Heligmosomoides polygyrus]|uniref:EF-hand domain-containing protein n=1 Tax=Heligmosomoides polygyrus TaxID=6339 RepID=A0A183G652_HELPZ|nr:unnamed protein product [Heligmosomoides polygyrus]
MWAESHTGGKEPAWQKAYLDYMFRLFDASGDKLVDLSEYVEVLGYFSIPREDAITCFDRFAVVSLWSSSTSRFCKFNEPMP